MCDLKKIRILIAGDWRYTFYEEPLYKSFLESGYDVYKFSWCQYYKYKYNKDLKGPKDIINYLYYKPQDRFTFGHIIKKINRDLISVCKEYNIDLLFIYRGTHILPSTLIKIKSMGCKIFGYNNDDPFSKSYKSYYWRHYMDCIPYYDHIFAFRHKNIDEYKKIGYNNVSLLRGYYIKERNYYIKELKNNKYTCDVLFIGHFENDGRDKCIKKIFDEGINIKIFGQNWRRSKLYPYFKSKLNYDIKPIYDDYNLAVNSAKIVLVFLSKVNNDTYTTRNFEIPVTKTMMISEYTEDLASIFIPDKDAVFFTNCDELIYKIKYYLSNDEKRKYIAENGYNAVVDKHEVSNRMGEILDTYVKCCR